MNIWKPDPVEQSPDVILKHWSVYELENGSRHFVGFNTLDHAGRTSSAIQQFDHKTQQGITRRGRKYFLDGPPGYHADAQYVWHSWCGINKIDVESVKNVTNEYAPVS